jgi:hypothetical protein
MFHANYILDYFRKIWIQITIIQSGKFINNTSNNRITEIGEHVVNVKTAIKQGTSFIDNLKDPNSLK